MAYSDVVLADGPIAYWQMQEASGNLADSSGNGYTATANGDPVYRRPGPERIGGFSIEFNDIAVTDYFAAEIATVNTSAGAEVMVEMWFNWFGELTLSASSELFAFVLPSTENYAVWIKARTAVIAEAALGFNTFNNDAYGVLSAGNFGVGFWYLAHLAFKEGARSSCRLWLNSVEKSPLSEPDGQPEGTGNDFDPTVFIGAGAGVQHGMTGRIAHVAVYNKWLSQARINAHWNASDSQLMARHGVGMGRW